MKKVLLIMLMAVTSMMASADVGEWSLGGQFVFGTEGSMPGVGLKFQSNYSHAWRSAVSGNYYFKKNGVSCFDLNAEQHYLFELGDKIRLYPLAGIRAAFWKVDDISANVGDVHIKVDGDSELKLGFNVGGGIDYLIGDHLMLNGEVKYEYLKNADWVLFSIGVGYRF